ncbi:MAG: exonuclease SbcCD subunit D C-terminal domain-containing protein, partial [Kofleriaceae bacterium]
PDVIVITGDIFDSATPPASAERMWFEWLAAARRARPGMDIIAIAGNHDSPARLGAPASVLRELGVHVVGSLPRKLAGPGIPRARAVPVVVERSAPVVVDPGAARDASYRSRMPPPRPLAAVAAPVLPIEPFAPSETDDLDFDRILIPVAGGQALVAAVPFLRPIDVAGEAEDPLAHIYMEVVAEAERRRTPGQAVIALGHLYVTGADPSFLSERRISIGGQESASLRMFPPSLDYVALGHMHRAQRVGRESIRYAGAPIALALDEAGYHHQIVIADFSDGKLAELRSLRVPQTIEIVRIAGTLDATLDAIAKLPARRDGEDPTRPYLDLMITLARPEPRLRTLIEAALERKRPRLVQLRTEHTGDGAALADRVGERRLAELDPREVFGQLWKRDHADPPSPAVIGAFQRLLEEVRGDRDDKAAAGETAQLRLGGFS